jgi:hypothetical protein
MRTVRIACASAGLGVPWVSINWRPGAIFSAAASTCCPHCGPRPQSMTKTAFLPTTMPTFGTRKIRRSGMIQTSSAISQGKRHQLMEVGLSSELSADWSQPVWDYSTGLQPWPHGARASWQSRSRCLPLKHLGDLSLKATSY